MEALTDGRLKEALQSLYIEHPASGNLPNIYARLLQGCIDMKALSDGKRIHTHMIKCCFQPRYAQHGYGEEALDLFRTMQRTGMLPDCITFVSLGMLSMATKKKYDEREEQRVRMSIEREWGVLGRGDDEDGDGEDWSVVGFFPLVAPSVASSSGDGGSWWVELGLLWGSAF
ncbi:hypothetical protein SUGI_0938780 [Cryptomeria japonica]|nr:hypothetical protein SUGI_0938780 [Cryptomeria japonica]